MSSVRFNHIPEVLTRPGFTDARVICGLFA